MSTQALAPVNAVALEKVLLQGDLSSLKPEERIAYYRELCASLDLNPLTKPFEYLELKGQGGKVSLTLYVKKDATDQIRNRRNASTRIVSREVVEGVYIVTAEASTPEGRKEESIGAVPIMKEGGRWHKSEGRNEFVGDGTFVPLRPEERANAMMKAETKAKRRATLSLFGLGMIDESEIETIRGARAVSVEQAHHLLTDGIDTGGHPVGTQAAADAVRDRKLANGKKAGTPATPPSRDTGRGAGAANATAPTHVTDADMPPLRPVPEELRIAVELLRANDYSALPSAKMFLEEECAVLGIGGTFTELSGRLATSGKTAANVERFMLDVWDAIVEARRTKEAAEFAEQVNG